MSIITYKIVSDSDAKLKGAAKLSCGFWNRFVISSSSIVIRLGIFTSFGNTIARAFRPYKHGDTVYGRVEFNTQYLNNYSEVDIVGTVIHEIGHVLGFGWDRWMELFNTGTGEFFPEYIENVPDLSEMRVETDYGPGTTLAHWDEELFDKELMTGFKDPGEYVLPVTINITSLLGHKVNEELPEKTQLSQILNELRDIQFTRTAEAKALNVDFFEESNIWEEIYIDKRTPFDSAK